MSKSEGSEVTSSAAPVQRILAEVASYYRIELPVLLGRDRTQRVAVARMTAMHFMRSLLGFSFPRIGMIFHRHYSTVIYSCKRVEKRAERAPNLKRELARLAEKTRTAIAGLAAMQGDNSI
jgi:chromosomal replication initiator protein